MMKIDITPDGQASPDVVVDEDHVIRNYPIKDMKFKDHLGKWQKIKVVANEDETKHQLAEIFGEQHYKKGLIKKDMVIVDIGANIGCSVLYFQPWAKVIYAIEPVPYCYYCLVENTKKFSNVKTFNHGIFTVNGEMWLTGGTEDSPPQTTYQESRFVQPINIKRLDTFFEENKIDHVDLLKIDCEGAEYEIFLDDGFKNVANKIDYIIGEAHNVPTISPEFLPNILKAVGFDAEFLPFDNLHYWLLYKNKTTGYKSKIFNQQQTIFFAKHGQA